MSNIVPRSNSRNNSPLFDFNGQPINIIIDNDGVPWFDGPDVCRVLAIKNPSDAYARLDVDEKRPLSTIEGSPRQNGTDRMYVSESGLYSLILLSRKFEAKTFKRWVTHEVLPAIRQTGSYSVEQMTPAEIILMQAQKLVDLERAQKQTQQAVSELHQIQGEQALRIDAVVDRLDDADYYSVRGWCRKQKINYTPSLLIMWGKRATELSAARNIERKETMEDDYPTHRYHKTILLDTCVAKPATNNQQALL